MSTTHRAAVGNPCAAEYAVNAKITSQRPLAMTYQSFSDEGVLHVQLAGISAHLFRLSIHADTRSPRRRDAEIPRRARP